MRGLVLLLGLEKMAIYWKNSSLPFRTRNWQIYKSPKELCFLISPYGAASCMHKQSSASPFLLYMACMIWGKILSLSLYLTLSVSLSLLSLHLSPPFSQLMSCCLFVFPLNLSRYLVFLSRHETIFFLSGTLSTAKNTFYYQPLWDLSLNPIFHSW